MILQVIIEGRIVYEDDAVYHVVPMQLVWELERQWRIHELQGAGMAANVAIVIPSVMNTKYYQSVHADD